MELNEDQKKQLDALHVRIKEIITLHRPLDITTEKIVDRAGKLQMSLGISRTNVLGCIAYVAMNAAVVGLTKDQVAALVNGSLEEADKCEAIKALSEAYTVENQKHLAKEAGLSGVVAPKSNIVH